jgi:hypothetical protein
VTTTQARLWAFADVYVSFSDAADPANINADFGGGWDLVGLLDGDDGFTHTRDQDINDHFAWGGILIRTSRAHFKQSVKFSALEPTNPTVFRFAVARLHAGRRPGRAGAGADQDRV